MDRVTLHEGRRYRPVMEDRPQPDDNWPYSHRPETPNEREFGVKKPKFERHVFIRRDQLMYDIDAELSMISDGRKKEDGTEDDTLTNATTKYRQLFYRWIDSHIGEAKTLMSAFVLEKYRDTAMNSIKDVEEVDITLLMPEWYDDTTFPQLCDTVHKYVVEATLYGFLQLRMTSKDPVTLDKKEQRDDAIDELRKLVNAAKPGRIKKILKPF